MKKSWLFVLLIIAMFGTAMYMRSRSAVTPEEEAAVDRLAWQTDFAKAQGLARAENKVTLINFTGSDWCPPCMRMRKEVFSRPEFAAYAKQNLVLLDVDFPRRTQLSAEQQAANEALAARFAIESFPTIVLTNPNGGELDRVGYAFGGAPAFIAKLERLKGDR